MTLKLRVAPAAKAAHGKISERQKAHKHSERLDEKTTCRMGGGRRLGQINAKDKHISFQLRLKLGLNGIRSEKTFEM